MASKQQAFEHLHISENLRVAVNTVSETEWKRFFESVKQAKFLEMENCDPKDLPEKQSQVKYLTELQNIFIGLKIPVQFKSQLPQN